MKLKINEKDTIKRNKITIATRFDSHPKFFAGGAERQMVMIGRELNKSNFDFHYITKKDQKGTRKNLELFNGIKIINLINNSKNKFKNFIFSFFYSHDLFFFLRYFFKLNYDIYHFRTAAKFMGIWAFIVKILKKKNFIFTVSHLIYCRPDLFKSKLYEFGLKRADVVIVLANYMKEELYRNYGVNPIVINSGHPIPNTPFKKIQPPMILWIGRLQSWKRPNLFLRIAKELQDLNSNFYIIGPGNYYKNEIKDFSLTNNNFTYISGVTPVEDNLYYEHASLIINTSLFEGFPNSFIQAWLHETPVISLNVDPDSIISKHGLGYHAKGNIDNMILRIKDLIKNPSKLKEIGKRSREYAIQNFNIIKTAEKHLRVYEWLIKKTHI